MLETQLRDRKMPFRRGCDVDDVRLRGYQHLLHIRKLMLDRKSFANLPRH